MVKSIKISGLFALLCLFLVFLGSSSVKADIGELPTPGGAITTGDKTDGVAMKSEDVYFDVKENTNQVTIGSAIPEYYAHVTATFTMSNLTDQQQDDQLFFPFYSNQYSGELQQSSNANITVNGQEAAATYVNDMFTNEQYDISAAVFNASFAPNSDTTIVVQYDIRAVNNAKSANLAFKYMMETGSHWAGNIGHGKVTFSFPWQISSTAPFAYVNDFFTAQDGKLVWEFDDLEPTSAQNIEVVFNPQILNAWQNRPGLIKSMSASTMEGLFYQPINIRTNNDDFGGVVSSNAVNLIDYSDDFAGWLVPQKEETFNEWVQFDLDATYTIKELQIRTGYLSSTPSEAGSGTDYFYDTYRHPKDMIITYSDGSTQNVTLQDTPAEYQTITLNSAATTSIKLSFANAYPGVSGGNNAFGVGRVKFTDATIVETTSNQQAQNTTEQSPTSTNYQPYIIGGVVAIIIIAGTTTWVIKRKKAGKIKISPNNTGESSTLPSQPKEKNNK